MNNVGDRVVPSTATGTASSRGPITGAVGLSTWATAAAYDDVKVTAPDGTALFSDDFSGDARQWTPLASRRHLVRRRRRVRAVRRRRAEHPGHGRRHHRRPTTTCTVKATKQSGAEGFLVAFGVKDSGNYYWWNLGGWNNTRRRRREGGRRRQGDADRQAELDRDRPHVRHQDQGPRHQRHAVPRRRGVGQLRRRQGRRAVRARSSRRTRHRRPDRQGRQRPGHPRRHAIDLGRRKVREHGADDRHQPATPASRTPARPSRSSRSPRTCGGFVADFTHTFAAELRHVHPDPDQVEGPVRSPAYQPPQPAPATARCMGGRRPRQRRAARRRPARCRGRAPTAPQRCRVYGYRP